MDYSAVPATAAAIHLLCRVEIKPDLNYSTREMFDVRYRQKSNQGLIQKFSEGVPPKCPTLKFQQCVALSNGKLLAIQMNMATPLEHRR